MRDERQQRHARPRIDLADRTGQVTVTAERIEQARRAEQVAHQEAKHRHACGEQQQRARRCPQGAGGVGQRHRARCESSAQHALRDHLQAHVQQHHEQDRGHGRARHIAGGIAHLARGHQRGLHAGVGEHHQHHRCAQRAEGRDVTRIETHQRPVDEEHAQPGQQEQRRELERGQRRDRARAQLHAERIEREQQQVGADQQPRARAGIGHRRKKFGHLFGVGRRDAGAGGDVADPHQRAGDEARERAEGRRDIRVGPARGRGATADRREAQRDRDDRQRTREQCERRGAAHLRGQPRRHAEHAAADDHVDHRGGQCERAHGAQQCGFALCSGRGQGSGLRHGGIAVGRGRRASHGRCVDASRGPHASQRRAMAA